MSTSRRRVLDAVEHRDVLPVPTDVFENGLYPMLEAELRRRLGLVDAPYDRLLAALGAELRWAAPAYAGVPLETATTDLPFAYPTRGVTRNIWGTWDGPETYADLYPRPLDRADTTADVDAHRWPSPNCFDYRRVSHFSDPESLTDLAEWSTKHANFARVISGWNPIFARMMDLCGFEQGLVNIALRPDITQAIVGRISEFYEEFYRRTAEAAAGHADFLGFGDDFADQRSLLLDPETWRRLFLPVWKRLFAVAHQNGLKTLMHLCGAVRPILGDLIDAGLDVYQVVQVSARGMDPVELKREFGSSLAFYGGMDTQRTLPLGTTRAVRDEVRERVEVLARGGGYILASTHFLMDDVPPENVLAMYEEARCSVPNWSSVAGGMARSQPTEPAIHKADRIHELAGGQAGA